MLSFTVTPTPSKGPSGSPFAQRASDSRAQPRVRSRSISAKALMLDWLASARSSVSFVTSTGDRVRRRKASPSAKASSSEMAVE